MAGSVLSITHLFVSTIADNPADAAAGKVVPSNWNSVHAVTGNLPVTQLNNGTGATSSTFWRGDGTWAVASGGTNPGGSNLQIQYNNSSTFSGANIWRTSATETDLSNASVPCSLRIYNTTDNNGGTPTNAEWASLDWSTNSNVLTIATVPSGSGSNRNINLSAGSQTTTFNTNGNINIPASILAPANSGQGYLFNDGDGTGLTYVVTDIVSFKGGTNNTGWFNYGGQLRVTSDFSVASSSTLSNVTGLTSPTLKAGRNYQFEVLLLCTDATAGGVVAAINASVMTATNIIYEGYTLDSNTVKGQTQATALGTAVGATTTTGTTPSIRIQGLVTVNAAGTMSVQFAQNASNATPSTVKRGSYMLIQDMP